MRNIRYAATAVFAAAGLLIGAAFSAMPSAHATTGPSANLPTTFKVSSKFAGQFVGQYVLKSVPAAAHIQSAALGIEVGNNGFLYGVGQFYGYDQSGNQSAWVATLYHFHQVGKSGMTLDLLSPSTLIVLGHMSFSPPKHANLVGKIGLSGHTYPIVFHQISTR
ncbi:MAG TPA: hypothetical protein VIJ28_02745 [Chloroflexota bacterium]|jgi:hypothetical protein